MTFYDFARPLGIAWLMTCYPYKTYGKENITNEGNVVIICNHLGKVDVPMVGRLFKGKSYFLAKQEWFNSKPRAWLFKQLGAIPIDRDHPSLSSMKMALGALKDGNRLCIFPEGTRNRENTDIMPLHGGAAMFAFKSKAKIIPINIHHRPKFWGKNYVYVGKSFDFSKFYGEKYDSELSEKLTQKMYDELCNAKNELEDILEKEGKIKSKKVKNK